MREKVNVYRDRPIRDLSVEQTMYETIKNANQENLDFEAIGYMGKSVTYAELLSKTDRLAIAFATQGVKQGKVVSVCLPNVPEVAEILLALSKIGAASQWIDLRSTDKQLVKYINEQNSKIFIGLDIFMQGVNDVIKETNLEKVIVITSNKPANLSIYNNDIIIAYDDFVKLADNKKSLASVSYDSERASIIIQSSGTTGLTKSIVHTDYTINSSIKCFNYFDYPFYVGNVLLVVAPPWVSYGLINSLYLSLAFGMKAELVLALAEDNVFSNIGKFDISFAVPLHYRYLAANIEIIDKNVLARVKCMVAGGDKIDKNELDILERIIGKPILNGYGCNEVLGAAVMSPLSGNKNGAVGLPLYGNSVKIFDMDTQIELPTGMNGEICINTETAFKEYVNNPTATANIKRRHSDGRIWIHTGDLGYVDAEGYVYVVGRIQRAIIRAGFKIFPGTIESVILSKSFISECVVVGVNDKQEGHVPMAHIVLNEGCEDNIQEIEKQLMELCKNELKDYERPKYFNFLARLPYTSNNKYDFRKLEEIGNKIVEKQVM